MSGLSIRGVNLDFYPPIYLLVNITFPRISETLPDALATGCQKCNEKQKATAEKVINHLRINRPKDWDRLVAKYDSQGHYKRRFEAQQAALRA